MSEELFKRYKIKAKKALGQNFLVNENIIEQISNVIDTTDKNIIEVGPGYGALTQKLLLQNLESLILVELDTRMVEILEDRIALGELEADNTNFKIENTDILKYIPNFSTSLPMGEIEGGFAKYSVIANIPYYITSPILRHFLYNLEKSPDEMVILMQKDVGDKIVAGQTHRSAPTEDIVGVNLCVHLPKIKKQKSSVISLMMAKKCYVSEQLIVGKQNFIPAPNVESSVLLFETHDKFETTPDKDFLQFIKIGFSSARKKLIKNFTNAGLDKNKILDIFVKINIDENIRGEAIGIEKWCELVGELQLLNNNQGI